MAARAVVSNHLARRELDAAVILEADPTQPRTTQNAIRHVKPPRFVIRDNGRPTRIIPILACPSSRYAPDSTVITPCHQLFTNHCVSQTTVDRAPDLHSQLPGRPDPFLSNAP